ncbi:molybdopterin cofactor-binding domain-containing protein [Bacteroidota bacterium]
MNPKNVSNQYSRRKFLKTTGSITIGFCLWEGCSAPVSEDQVVSELPRGLNRYPNINAWIEILENGGVRVLTGKMELGQGIRIAVAQVAAEELNTDIDNVEVNLAETERTPNEGYTAGSRSIESSAMNIRFAAAAAKEKLLDLAAAKLQIEKDQLVLDNGTVRSKKTDDSLSFKQILEGAQIVDEVQSPVTLKSKSKYSYVGKAIPRKDIKKMVRGDHVFVQDLRFPGMVHARVVRPPNYGSKLEHCDQDGAKKIEGVIQVVRNGNFLAVIAEEEYQAIQAAQYMKENFTWSQPEIFPEDIKLDDYLVSLAVESENVKNEGNTEVLNDEEDTISARYYKPYIMHGSMGPSCAVAIFENDQLHIWSHTQGVYPLKGAIQDMLGLNEEQVHVKGVPGSGCYGHNGADDVGADAALLAMAFPGKHIRLQWSREDEHTWEPYGTAMVMQLKAKLDESGKITHWAYDLWSDASSGRPGGDPARLLPAWHLTKPFVKRSSGSVGGSARNSEPYYQIPNLKIDTHLCRGPLRVSSLRSLGAFGNIFAIESFIDELAVKAGKDPLKFRLAHLTDERAHAVIKKIGDLTKSEAVSKSEGIGYAFSKYKNVASYFAVAVKVSHDESTGRINLEKMWGVIDSGEVINPDGLKNQTEGGMIQAASWTLHEQVTFNKHRITNMDWGTYPILRFDNIPQMEVVVIDRPNEPPLGAGEAAQGPTGAAVANAVFRATGKRIRELPIGVVN